MLKMELIGNLVRDPETRTFNDGKSVTNFTVAVNKRLSNGETAADYVSVAAWDKLGENCAKYLAKGRRVYVSGRPSARGYMSRDNSPRASLELTADDVEFQPSAKAAPAAEPAQAESYSEVDDDELPF